MKDMSNQLRNHLLHNDELRQRLNYLYHQVLADEDVNKFLKQHSELTKDDIVQSMAQLFEYINQRNRVKKGNDSIAPGYMPSLEVHERHISVTYVPTEQLLQQQKNTQMLQRILTIDVPTDVKQATFDDYQKGARSRIPALSAVIQFSNDYIENPHIYHQGLYLHGPFGVGKTYLLGALARVLAEKGYRSMLIHMPTFNAEMKDAINNHQVIKRINKIKKVPILMLDDVGADDMSAWIRDEVLGVILQYRMEEHLSTFFTSNLTMDEFAEHLTFNNKGDNEPIKADRIMERVKFLAKDVPIDGPDRRNDFIKNNVN